MKTPSKLVYFNSSFTECVLSAKTVIYTNNKRQARDGFLARYFVHTRLCQKIGSGEKLQATSKICRTQVRKQIEAHKA